MPFRSQPPRGAPGGGPAAAGDEAGAEVHSESHGRFARIAIGISIFVTLLMVSVIYVRWLKVSEPTSAIMLNGDKTCEGATLVVSAPGRPDVTASLNEANGYSTPVLLYPGSYTITLTHDAGVLVQREVILGPRQALRILVADIVRHRRQAEAAAASSGR